MLKLKVETLDNIPEPLREMYAEADGGGYQLQVEGIEDTTGLKTALQKERENARKAAAQAKQWERIGKTPDEIAEMLEAQSNPPKPTKDESAALREQFQKQLAAKDEQIGTVKKTLEKQLVDAAAVQAIAAANGIPELLLPHVKSRVRVIESEGEYRVQVLDSNGTPLINNKGSDMTITELVSEMRQSDVFAPAFRGSGAQGSGTPPFGNAGKSGGLTKSWADCKTPAEKVEFLKRKNNR